MGLDCSLNRAMFCLIFLDTFTDQNKDVTVNGASLIISNEAEFLQHLFLNSDGNTFDSHKITYNKTISKGVVLIISPLFKRLFRRSSYLHYNQYKHCGFVSISLQLDWFEVTQTTVTCLNW